MSCPGTRLRSPSLCALDEPCGDRRTCDGCGAVFCVAPSRPHRFCSDSCRRAARSGQGNHNYKGGLSFTNGRWYVCCRNGSALPYARAVMAAHIGRLLTPDEIVHHISGDPTDDRIENLQLTNRRDHAAIHRPELNAAIRAWRRERRQAA